MAKAAKKKVAKKSIKKSAKKTVKKSFKKAVKKTVKPPRKKNASRFMRAKPRKPKELKLKMTKKSALLTMKIKKQRTKETILILDFGSQYTQLIARRIRESKVFSRIVPFNISIEAIKEINPKGIILSGGPMSVYDKHAPMPNKEIFKLGINFFGSCFKKILECQKSSPPLLDEEKVKCKNPNNQN